ncbi:uncharacterized protein LOC113202757 isoform X3 [Frankliniella occidentalis]|uniref:Uncharacterized protein LOC113202757 isoform X3 n=1 Tax=Frankliniella occidentalis TaxID=133901 RepID=A0A9C6U3W4_FRAOC|nr:uncharacterized protein LOC113202757 isoform X3 [Frankliniella occidentalis]
MCCERLEGVGSWRLRRRPGRQWPCGRLAGWTLGPDSLSRAGGRVMMCSATALTCATTPTPRMTPDPLWITYSFKSEECRRRAADNRPRLSAVDSRSLHPSSWAAHVASAVVRERAGP